ncbi:hypothetical protein KQX54_010298 [Cotesia glomerata]|uniref:Uncharacterized protein n=1 Tax=Cotesia glomerata TaxID=32391 RepID=A0AAV7IQH6_COTGL|nr:hypothetical protein KQX54_010298 [Cotesia glomerata]
MEVLDPKITHDDTPLFTNDSIEKLTLRQRPEDTKSFVKARYTLEFPGFMAYPDNIDLNDSSLVNDTFVPCIRNIDVKMIEESKDSSDSPEYKPSLLKYCSLTYDLHNNPSEGRDLGETEDVLVRHRS